MLCKVGLPVADLAVAIADEINDPDSDFNTLATLRDRLARDLLGGQAVDALEWAEADEREAIGSALLRAYWLGQGMDTDEVLAEWVDGEIPTMATN